MTKIQAPAGQQPVFVAHGVTAGYGRVSVVHDVGLELAAGSYLGVIGANGAGKSTLLKALAGVITPHAGQIRLAGHDVTGAPAWIRWRRGLAFVPESRELFAELTVEEHLHAGCTGSRKRDRGERIDFAYELFPTLNRPAPPHRAPAVRRPTADARHREGGDLPAEGAVARRTIPRPVTDRRDGPRGVPRPARQIHRHGGGDRGTEPHRRTGDLRERSGAGSRQGGTTRCRQCRADQIGHRKRIPLNQRRQHR